MKKSIPVLFLTITVTVVFAFFYYKLHSDKQLAETTLSKSFEATGAKVVSSEVYCWGRLDTQYGTKENAEPIVKDILKSLGVLDDNALKRKVYENDIISKTEIKGTVNDNEIVEITAQFGKSAGAIGEKHISVKVTEDLSSTGLEDVKKSLVKVFEKYKINPKVNACITGSFDGKLNNEQLNNISVRAFKETEAMKVEGVRDNNYISVSAYSPKIEDSLSVNGKKVNLNLAIRYSSYENKTYIWLATPIIATEY